MLGDINTRKINTYNTALFENIRASIFNIRPNNEYKNHWRIEGNDGIIYSLNNKYYYDAVISVSKRSDLMEHTSAHIPLILTMIEIIPPIDIGNFGPEILEYDFSEYTLTRDKLNELSIKYGKDYQFIIVQNIIQILKNFKDYVQLDNGKGRINGNKYNNITKDILKHSNTTQRDIADNKRYIIRIIPTIITTVLTEIKNKTQDKMQDKTQDKTQDKSQDKTQDKMQDKKNSASKTTTNTISVTNPNTKTATGSDTKTATGSDTKTATNHKFGKTNKRKRKRNRGNSSGGNSIKSQYGGYKKMYIYNKNNYIRLTMLLK